MQAGSTNQAQPEPRPDTIPSIDKAATAFKQQLLGSSPNQLNLAAVRARAEDLKKSLEQIVAALQYNAHNITWSDTLDKFAILNVQYHNLREQLRALLKTFVVHPTSVNRENAPILPIMLATKELPEMEAHNAALLAMHHARMGTQPGPVQYEALTHEIETFSKLIDELTIQTKSGTGVLDAKSPLRKEIAQTGRSAAAPSTSSLGAAGRRSSLGSKAKRAKTEGPDLLLAAALSGEGLKNA